MGIEVNAYLTGDDLTDDEADKIETFFYEMFPDRLVAVGHRTGI